MANDLITTNREYINTTPGQAITSEAFNSWLAYLDTSEKTKESYTRSIRQFAIFLKVNGIMFPTESDVIAYKESLKLTHKPTTVQAYLAAVKVFFRWTAKKGYYPNIAADVKGVKLDTEHKKDYLTSKQTNRLLSKIDRSTTKGKRDFAILALMVTTGLRTISVIRANIEDLRTAGDSTVLYYQGKGHEEKATYVKIAPEVEDAILDYLADRAEAAPEAPLFASLAHNHKGEQLTTKSISRLVKDHMIDVGLNSDRLTAHSLRHTAATLNLLNGATVEETRQLLDHSNINTTLIYSHALERAKNNSELRIANAIFNC